ncbi:hypothetical protein GCM10027027_23210 [Neomicrococcus lactis]
MSAQIDGHPSRPFNCIPTQPVQCRLGTLTILSESSERNSFVANIKSQKKRILTNEKSRVRNLAVRSELKTLVRAVNEAVTAADKEAAEKALRTANRKLDKAVSKGVIHKNQAANRKSAISKKVAAL